MHHQERFYTLVGFFVFGALCLIVFLATFLYDEYVHSRSETYVMFFKGSLNGLEPTSMVTYRGVKIGEVKLIEVTENKKKHTVELPAYVEFFVEKSFTEKYNPIRILIDKGFVANITAPNFLTGSSKIELIKSRRPHHYKLSYYKKHPIFPTRNTINKFTTLDEALKTAKKTFEDISELVNSKEFTDMITAMRLMATSVDAFAGQLNQDTPFIVSQFNKSLSNISKAASSMQSLTDYLSRYPESLLRGKH